MTPASSKKNSETEVHPRPVPEIKITTDRQNPLALWANCVGLTTPYQIQFGQGSVYDMQPTTAMKRGVYGTPGAYMIYAHNGETGSKLEVYAWRQVVLRGDKTVHVDLEPVMGGKPGEYRLKAQDDGIDAASRYSVDWGDNSIDGNAVESVWLAPGQEYRKVLTNGEHDVKVYDEHGLRTRHFQINVDGSVNDTTDPQVTVTRDDSDTTGYSVILEFTKVDEQKAVIIDWGEDVEDYTQEIAAPKKGQKVKHKYADQPQYVGLAYYKDGSGVQSPFSVTIPWPKDAAA